MFFNNIEIDLLNTCNLNCYNCSRGCSKGLAPSTEEMSIEQVDKFIWESKSLGVKWNELGILGGEPLLHKDIFNIILKLKEITYSMELSTNGIIKDNRLNFLEKRNIITIRNSNKTGNVNVFRKIFIAPIDYNFDLIKHKVKEPCYLTHHCGININRYGYYVCAIAYTIDRIFGFNIGIKQLKDVNNKTLQSQKEIVCKYCGFLDNVFAETELTYYHSKSKTWEEAFKKFQINKPVLTLY